VAIIVRGEVVCDHPVADLRRSGTTLEEIYFDYAGQPATGNLEWLGRR
jgi:hypothetical protein